RAPNEAVAGAHPNTRFRPAGQLRCGAPLEELFVARISAQTPRGNLNFHSKYRLSTNARSSEPAPDGFREPGDPRSELFWRLVSNHPRPHLRQHRHHLARLAS